MVVDAENQHREGRGEESKKLFHCVRFNSYRQNYELFIKKQAALKIRQKSLTCNVYFNDPRL